MPATIRLLDPEGREVVLDLDPGRRYRVGRSGDNDITLSDLGLSRHHAEIYCEGGVWFIRDSGSSNGTFVEDRRLDAPARLGPGVKVRLGASRLEFGVGERSNVLVSDRPVGVEGTLMFSAAELLREPEAIPGQVSESAMQVLRKRFGIVQKATLELLAHEPMEVLLPKILDLAFDAVRPDRAALLSRDSDGQLKCRVFRGAGREEFSISRTIAERVLDQRISVMTSDARSDAFLAEAKSIEIQGVRSVMAVPLWNQEEVIGLLYVDSRLRAADFTDDDLRLLTMLGNIAAIQIQNARLFEEQVEKQRFEREAQAAAEIQRKLLPVGPPAIPGYRFFGHNRPCYEVGGDYYDCVPLGATRRGIIIADVSGKGMGAALLMASLQANYLARADVAPAVTGMTDLLNTAIYRNTPEHRFVTAFLIDLDLGSNRVTWVNAGHAPPPILVRRTGELMRILPGGPPLGVFPEMPYETGMAELDVGDILFACSDGLTEAVSPTGEMFGDDRLMDMLARLAGRPPDEVGRNLGEALDAFAAGAPQPDDLTIIALQREA